MLLSGFFTAKKHAAKKAETKKRENAKAARARLKNGTAKPGDNFIARMPVIPVSAFWGACAAVCGFIESIPVTLVVIKIIVIILILSFILLMIQWIVAAISSSMLGTVLDAAEAFAFSNPYQQSVSQDYDLDANGGWRITIKRSSRSSNAATTGGGEEDPDDPDTPYNPSIGGTPTPIIDTTNDIDLWTNISDAQIIAIADSWAASGADFKKGDNVYYKVINVMRFIRMAYRICFITDDTGNRVFPNLEPATLIGTCCFEKDFVWTAPIMKYSGSTVTNWYTLSSGSTSLRTVTFNTNSSGAVTSSNGNVADLCNIHTAISGLFYNKAGYKDGPYSFTYSPNFTSDLRSKIKNNKAYTQGFNKLVKTYKEYEAYGQIVSDSFSDFTGLSSDGLPFTLKTAFLSMFMTACNADYFHPNNYWGSATKMGDAPPIKDDFSEYIVNSSQNYWKNVAAYTAKACMTNESYATAESENRLLESLICYGYGYSRWEDIPVELMRHYSTQIFNALIHQFHHLPGLADTGAGNYYYGLYTDNEGRSMSSLGYTPADYKAALTCLIFWTIYLNDGNLSYIYSSEIQDAISDTKWTPFSGSLMPIYKGGVSGDWFNYDIFNTKNGGHENWKDLTRSSVWHGGSSVTITYKKLYSQGKLYHGALPSSVLDTASTYWRTSTTGYANNSEVIDRVVGTGGEILKAMVMPIAFSASNGLPFGKDVVQNLHALSCEGMLDVLCGNDIVKQFTTAVSIRGAGIGGGGSGSLGDGSIKYNSTLPYADNVAKSKLIYADGGFAGFSDDSYSALNSEKKAFCFPIASLADDTIKIVSVNGEDAVAYVSTGVGSYLGNDGSPRGWTDAKNVWHSEVHKGIDVAVSGGSPDTQNALCKIFNANRANYGFSTIFDLISKDKKALEAAKNRAPLVAPADGYITKVNVNRTGYASSSYGNAIYMTYKRYQGTDVYEDNVVFGHLSPDFLWVLMSSLQAQGIDTSPLKSATNSWTGNNAGNVVPLSSKVPVPQGTLMGFVGNTGTSYGAHLHFEILGDTGNTYDAVTHKLTSISTGETMCRTWFGSASYTFALDGSGNKVIEKNAGKKYYPFSSEWMWFCRNPKTFNGVTVSITAGGVHMWYFNNIIALMNASP